MADFAFTDCGLFALRIEDMYIGNSTYQTRLKDFRPGSHPTWRSISRQSDTSRIYYTLPNRLDISLHHSLRLVLPAALNTQILMS